MKPEASLSRAVRQMLSLIGDQTEKDRWVGDDWIIWRENSGAVNLPGQRFIRYGTPGIGDFAGVIRGTPVMIELKAPGGRLRSTQKKFCAEFRSSGGLYTVIRSVDDLRALFDAVK